MKIAELRSFVRIQVIRLFDLSALAGSWFVIEFMIGNRIDLQDFVPVGLAICLVLTLGPTRRTMVGISAWSQGLLSIPLMAVATVFAVLWLMKSPQNDLLRIWAVAAPITFLSLRGLGFLSDRTLLDAGIGRDLVLLVGSPSACDRVASDLKLGHCHDSRLVGRIEVGADGRAPADLAAHLAAPDALRTLVCPFGGERTACRHCRICVLSRLRVVICPDGTNPALAEQVLELLQDLPVTVQWAPRFDAAMAALRQTAFQPVVDLRANPLDPGQQVLKWCEDKVLAVIILAIVAIPMTVVALLVKITSPGPVLFIQERHGLHGNIIKMFKFRSMCNAPTPLEKLPIVLPPAAHESSRRRTSNNTDGRNEEDSEDSYEPSSYQPSTATFRQTEVNDSRLTPIGSFLRKTSIDELPQLFNVLKGDMSIVGPRPHAVQHNLQYIGSVKRLMRRHYIKPGITGLAQVSGARGATRTIREMRRRVALDMIYMQNWSLMLDLKILYLTVFRGLFTHKP